jgi:predicted transcriptional regulator of viral defense system
MVESGVVERLGRGLYRLADGEGYDHPDLVEAALRVPKGVVVLLSALNFHGIGTQVARQVWMQLPANYPTPRIEHPPLWIVRSRKPEAFTLGVETHRIAGHAVRITDPDGKIEYSTGIVSNLRQQARNTTNFKGATGEFRVNSVTVTV